MENILKKEVIIDNTRLKRIVIKNMILLLTGQLVSLLGSSVYTFAMGLYILNSTGSGLSFSLTIALGTIPRVLFGPISGVVADRVDRKKMIVLLDLLSGVVVIGLFALSVFDDLRLIYVYVASFLLATCGTFFQTPLEASIPNLVDEKRLMKISSLSQAITSMSTISGPFIGGIVFALIDIKLFLLFNGLSFIFSGISTIFVDFKAKEKIYGIVEKSKNDTNAENNFFEDFKEGIRYVLSKKWLLILGCFSVFFNMFYIIGISVSVPYIAVEVWGISSKQLGILNMMTPIGMILGSVVIFLLPEGKNNYKRILSCLLISSLGILSTGILTCDKIITLDNNTYLMILIPIYIVLAISSVSFTIPLNVTLQKHVPNEMLGRVRSVFLTFVMGLSPLGAIIGGALLDIVYPWLLPMISGIILVIITLIASRVKALKAI
ncbi:MFS transporter [Lysinibacillus xylanilyticus]|uniref:MFS transporter n=1 Tax=Lysinibacillus xylanilyticus TaxID=582475 RepID=UPI003822E38B